MRPARDRSWPRPLSGGGGSRQGPRLPRQHRHALATGVAGGQADRKRPFSLPRLTGARLGMLCRVIALESAVPLLAVAAAAIGTGFGASPMYAAGALSNVLLDGIGGLSPHAGAKLLSGLNAIKGADVYPGYLTQLPGTFAGPVDGQKPRRGGGPAGGRGKGNGRSACRAVTGLGRRRHRDELLGAARSRGAQPVRTRPQSGRGQRYRRPCLTAASIAVLLSHGYR
jgi:hypothetical protein